MRLKFKFPHFPHKPLFLFTIIMLSLLSGCIDTDGDCLATESIAYSEEHSQYSFTLDVLHTETVHAHYYFEQTLDETLRQTCIENTDSIISNLGNVSAKPQIYIFSGDTFNGVNIIGNSLYTCQDSYQNVDYVTNVVLAVYGDCRLCHERCFGGLRRL